MEPICGINNVVSGMLGRFIFIWMYSAAAHQT
jgi:hypothetical protein